MESDSGNLEGFVDAIADRVLGRLTGRPNRGPTGEPASQLPDLSEGQEEIPSLVVVPGFAFRDSSSLNRPSTTAPDMGRRIPCLSWRSSRWSCAPTPM